MHICIHAHTYSLRSPEFRNGPGQPKTHWWKFCPGQKDDAQNTGTTPYTWNCSGTCRSVTAPHKAPKGTWMETVFPDSSCRASLAGRFKHTVLRPVMPGGTVPPLSHILITLACPTGGCQPPDLPLHHENKISFGLLNWVLELTDQPISENCKKNWAKLSFSCKFGAPTPKIRCTIPYTSISTYTQYSLIQHTGSKYLSSQTLCHVHKCLCCWART